MKSLFLLLISLVFFPNSIAQSVKEKQWEEALEHYIDDARLRGEIMVQHPRSTLDTLYKQWGVHINFTEEFAYHYLRAQDVETITSQIREALDISKHKRLKITVDGLPLSQYVPVYYSNQNDRVRQAKPAQLQHVQNTSNAYQPTLGLQHRHIALWNSHGKYYNHTDSCWKWQRAPLFTTVEDLFTSTYVLPFLVPMLEQAGANVYLPRERDVQTQEVIVDNSDDGFSVFGEAETLNYGFKNKLVLDRSTLNPFKEGTSLYLKKGSEAVWEFAVPERGSYAVYVSYAFAKRNSKEAIYTVFHSGGHTVFKVNQQMGAGTWVYLGHFDFDQLARVTLVAERGRAVADAVRLGGGMGSILRNGTASGVPRWQEAARYYLQYAGALDSLTFNRHGDTIDYNDDFRSRARWVNYLIGDKAIEPWIKGDEKIQGLDLPIDLAMGLHTDAGHFEGMDTTVGALAIYSTYDVDKNRDFYYSKKSRLTNRDLADLVQTQLVDDVRALYDSSFTRREMWDKMYSEATFAQVPALLLELHGHANAQDMRYGLHPQFRFDVSRAIYKACLRFLSTYYRADYVVQPLPVQTLAIQKKGERYVLRWTPTLDPLEPSAAPQAYMVYKQYDGIGWDNGTLVNGTHYVLPSDSGICTYKVVAINAGGASCPSVKLSLAAQVRSEKSVLVIDGFTRVDAPAFMQSGDSVGVAPWVDEGVPYGLDLGTIGRQYNYNQKDPWQSDDEPGHGGSGFELSNRLFLGNNFNQSYTYVRALAQLGYQVVSCSAAAVEKAEVQLDDYDVVILAYGEQRSSYLPNGKKTADVLDKAMLHALRSYLDSDGKLYINGAHIATSTLEGEMTQRAQRKQFLENDCGIAFASKVKPAHHRVTHLSDSLAFDYNVDYCKDYYRVENADAFEVLQGAEVLGRYANGCVATVQNAQGNVIVSGVPFETIIGEQSQVETMRLYLDRLLNKVEAINED